MSDMHVINGDGKCTWRVVMHFDVPNVNNSATVNYRTALKNSSLVDAANPSVLPDGNGEDGSIGIVEKQQLVDGVKYELVLTIRLDGSGSDNASRILALRAAYARTETETIVKLKNRLKYFGYNESRN